MWGLVAARLVMRAATSGTAETAPSRFHHWWPPVSPTTVLSLMAARLEAAARRRPRTLTGPLMRDGICPQRLADSRTVKGPPTRSDPFGVSRLSP